MSPPVTPDVCPHPKCCLCPPLGAKGCHPLRLPPQCPLHPFWDTPRSGGVPTGADPPALPTALSHLRIFTILAGLLMAIVAVAIVALLAVKVWPR